MKNSKSILFLGSLLAIHYLFNILNLANATDYCNPALCMVNDKSIGPHIGCNNDGSFASRCINPSPVSVEEFKEIILNTHNDLRNKIANGTLAGFESARRMPTLTWDDELEYLATLNTRRCITDQHDDCRNTYEFKYSGQNMGDMKHNNDPMIPSKYEGIIIYLIKLMFYEYSRANQNDLDILVDGERLDRIGHFTQLVQDKAAKVGCGLARFDGYFKGEYFEYLQLVCNYSYSNLLGEPAYVKGPMASGCKTGTNPKFKALCSVDEDIVPLPEGEAKLTRTVHRRKKYTLDENLRRMMPYPVPQPGAPTLKRRKLTEQEKYERMYPGSTKPVSPAQAPQSEAPRLKQPHVVKQPVLPIQLPQAVPMAQPPETCKYVAPSKKVSVPAQSSETCRYVPSSRSTNQKDIPDRNVPVARSMYAKPEPDQSGESCRYTPPKRLPTKHQPAQSGETCRYTPSSRSTNNEVTIPGQKVLVGRSMFAKPLPAQSDETCRYNPPSKLPPKPQPAQSGESCRYTPSSRSANNQNVMAIKERLERKGTHTKPQAAQPSQACKYVPKTIPKSNQPPPIDSSHHSTRHGQPSTKGVPLKPKTSAKMAGLMAKFQ